MFKCAVKGCGTKRSRVGGKGGITLHSFPNPKLQEGRFQTWVSRCGDTDLLKVTPLAFAKKRVCHNHFILPHPLMTSLPKDSVPELLLPEPIIVPHEFIHSEGSVLSPTGYKSSTSMDISSALPYTLEEDVNSPLKCSAIANVAEYGSSVVVPESMLQKKMSKCFVGGCEVKRPRVAGTGITLHTFPNPRKDREHFKKFVEACGNATLLKEKPSSFYKYRVCHKHFQLPHPLMTSLPKNVIPQLYLPDPITIPPGWLDELDMTVIEPSNVKVASPVQCDMMNDESSSKTSKFLPPYSSDNANNKSVIIPKKLLHSQHESTNHLSTNHLSEKSTKSYKEISEDEKTIVKNILQRVKCQNDEATVLVDKPKSASWYTDCKRAPKAYSKFFFCKKNVAKTLMKNIPPIIEIIGTKEVEKDQKIQSPLVALVNNNPPNPNEARYAECESMDEESDYEDEESTKMLDERLVTHCRICAKECTDMKNIYEDSNKDILELLKIYTDIVLSHSDTLPKQICQNCIAEVTTCHNFRLKCNKSDIFLRELFLDINIDNKDNNSHKEDDENELKCKTCGLVCKTYAGLSLHKLKYKEEPCNFCVICDKTVQYPMQRHMLVHPGLNPYVCLQCGKKFENKGHLISHQYDFHKICKKRLETYTKMSAHRKVHKLKKQTFLCSSCGAKFASSKGFEVHNKKHAGNKDIKCTRCDEKFYTNVELTRHQNHCKSTNNEPYICFTCGEVSPNQPDFEEHFLIHFDQKLYNCRICGAGFSYEKELTTHVKTHTGPYECFFCDESFQEASLLDIHHFRVHKYCEICGRTFRRYHHLKRHKHNIHNAK